MRPLIIGNLTLLFLLMASNIQASKEVYQKQQEKDHFLMYTLAVISGTTYSIIGYCYKRQIINYNREPFPRYAYFVQHHPILNLMADTAFAAGIGMGLGYVLECIFQKLE